MKFVNICTVLSSYQIQQLPELSVVKFRNVISIYISIEFEVTKFKFIKWRNISYFKCIQMEYVFIAQKVAMLYSLFHPCKGKQAVDCSGRQPFLATRRISPSAAFVKNSKF